MTELDTLEAHINALLLKIQNAENIEAAGVYFDQLENIQAVVSGLIFQKQIKVSDCMWKFFKDFDRADDYRVREYLFKRIKNNDYSLASGGFLWYR